MRGGGGSGTRLQRQPQHKHRPATVTSLATAATTQRVNTRADVRQALAAGRQRIQGRGLETTAVIGNAHFHARRMRLVALGC